MPARPRPAAQEILAVLDRAADGKLADRALNIHQATRSLRLAFRTTTTVAWGWLESLSNADKPILRIANAGSHRALSTVWREGWIPTREEGLPGGEHGIHDYITLRADGTQALGDSIQGDATPTQWVLLTPTLHTMAMRVRQKAAEREKAQAERKAARLAAFDEAHPGAREAAREFLARAGATNLMTSVEVASDYGEGTRIDGRRIGGRTVLTLTVYAEDIEPVAALLASVPEVRA